MDRQLAKEERANAVRGYGTIDERTKQNIRHLEEAEVNAAQGRDFVPNEMLSPADARLLHSRYSAPVDKEMLALKTQRGRPVSANTSRATLAGVVNPDTGKLISHSKRETRSGVVGPGHRYHWDAEMETLRNGGWSTGRPFAAVGTAVRDDDNPFGKLDPENPAALAAAGYNPTHYGHPPASLDGWFEQGKKFLGLADKDEVVPAAPKHSLGGGKRKKSRRRTKKQRPRRKTRVKRSNRRGRTRRR